MSDASFSMPSNRAHLAQPTRWFFLGAVLLMFAVIVYVHGARFFLVGFYRPPDFHTAILHIHVAIVASWMLVLLAQALLGSVRNVALHRRLGLAGFLLAILMLVFGILATADMLHREPRSTSGSIVPTTQILSFALFAGLAYLRRSDREAHKRLILLAMVDPIFGVLVPVTHRFMQPVEHYANLSWIFLLLLAAYDLATRRRLHRVTVWGSMYLMVLQDIRVPLGHTAAWIAIAEWMRSWRV